VKEFTDGVPAHLTGKQRNGGVFWAEDCWAFHTTEWWRNLWDRTTLVDVLSADLLPEGWSHWARWEKAVAAYGPWLFPPFDETLEADGGEYIGWARMIGRKR
jgi:hypothetical protein